MACFGLFKKQIKENTPTSFQPLESGTVKNEYKVKTCLMTATEINYYNCLRSILPSQFIVQPQVNLATVLEKDAGSYYQNELYRNIDFCIFDNYYRPLLLIEINDETHRQPKRIERDKKVAEICASAGLPLIRFWTKYGIDSNYISKKMREYLQF